jgi:hypothetical protein
MEQSVGGGVGGGGGGTVVQLVKFPACMEPKGSFLCSQEPGPCLEPDESNPHNHIFLFILILSSHLRLGFLSGVFPSGLVMEC